MLAQPSHSATAIAHLTAAQSIQFQASHCACACGLGARYTSKRQPSGGTIAPFFPPLSSSLCSALHPSRLRCTLPISLPLRLLALTSPSSLPCFLPHRLILPGKPFRQSLYDRTALSLHPRVWRVSARTEPHDPLIVCDARNRIAFDLKRGAWRKRNGC